jgi:hypothetical protein
MFVAKLSHIYTTQKVERIISSPALAFFYERGGVFMKTKHSTLYVRVCEFTCLRVYNNR